MPQAASQPATHAWVTHPTPQGRGAAARLLAKCGWSARAALESGEELLDTLAGVGSEQWPALIVAELPAQELTRTADRLRRAGYQGAIVGVRGEARELDEAPPMALDALLDAPLDAAELERALRASRRAA